MRVLVIEDDAVSRLLVTRSVTERGNEVVACQSAEAGIVECSRGFFPLIILDLHLPGMDGLEFCRWVKSQPWGEQTFVLVATGRNQPEDLQNVLAAGGNDYLSKPFDVGLLRVRLAIADGHVREISQRKQAQELNRVVLRTAIDGFWSVDNRGTILEVNDTYCRLTGFSRDQLLGKFICDLEVDGVSGTNRTPLDGARATGGARYETRHRCADARLIDLDVTVSYVGGYEERFFFFLRDNTERKHQAEEGMKTSKLESIGLLAGGIAHEFNNALTSIIGNLSLTQTELPEKHPAMDWLANAQSSASRATALARQLLTFAKGGEPIRVFTAVTPLLEEAIAKNFTDSSYHVFARISPELWSAEIDRGQFRQVLDNLMSNAREAMPGGGKIEISAGNFAHQSAPDVRLKPGNYIKFSIRDYGCGISSDTLPKIFDPYFSTKKGNNGLGLAISYSVMKKHGGAVSVESEPGNGTQFNIYLPAAEKAVAIPAPGPETPSDKRCVLLVDDDPAVRDLMSALLGRMGYFVQASKEGGEALQVYDQARQAGRPFDVVIMDLTIPEGMGGKVAVQELLKIDPQARAIVCSGYSNDPVMANYELFGFKARIAKPFSGDDLKRTISSVLSLEACVPRR